MQKCTPPTNGLYRYLNQTDSIQIQLTEKGLREDQLIDSKSEVVPLYSKAPKVT